MSDLRKKLKSVEDEIAQMRVERSSKLEARNKARDAFAATEGYDVNSDEYKTAHEAVKSLGEIEEKIADTQAAQVGILKMLGQSDEPRQVNKADEFDGDPMGAIFKSDNFREVQKYAQSRGRFGNISLGEMSNDLILKANTDPIEASTNQRQSTSYGVVQPLYRSLSVLDLIPTGPASGNNVPYVKYSPGPATAAKVTEGARKPQRTALFEDDSVDIDTIASWIRLKKQTLADAAAVRTIVETQLRFDVRAALEGYIVAEILATSGIGSTTYAAEPIADLISHSMVDIVLADLNPTAVVLHPRDWERIRLSKDENNGGYQFGPPSQVGESTVFGLRTVASTAVEEGQPLVADFERSMVLFVREGLQVLVSDSNEDDFVKNMVSVLAELRAGLAVLRPSGVSTVDISAGT